jgi:hypothetical protein
MGKAKQRRESAKQMAQAKERKTSIRPKRIVCNNCQSEIKDFHKMDTRGMKGIDAAYAGVCNICRHDTWAIKGDPAAVAELSMIMEDESGVAPLMGAQVVDH